MEVRACIIPTRDKQNTYKTLCFDNQVQLTFEEKWAPLCTEDEWNTTTTTTTTTTTIEPCTLIKLGPWTSARHCYLPFVSIIASSNFECVSLLLQTH